MPNGINSNLRNPVIPMPLGRSILQWNAQYVTIEIVVLLALAIAVYFLGHHLLDGYVPSQGDVRSHIFKIELLQSYLSHFSWPQWNQWWYLGIPEDQFYPPGFYFLGAVLGFVVKSGVVAYKILLLVVMILNGLLIYFFARRFLRFDSYLAIWCLIAYETSTPLLVNFLYGEGPNLLGWSVTIGFLTLYLSHLIENKPFSRSSILLPGLILGVAILIHPFPVIFAIMAVALFHAVWLLHTRNWHIFSRDHLPYFVGVFIIGGLVGMYYWLPAIFTLHLSSPIYSVTKFQWPGGTIYLLVMVLLAVTVFVVTRIKVRNDPKLDFLFVCFALASALGFGATNYLPFGLGSLVQEFRFASMIVPFFSILLILIPLKYQIFRLNGFNLVLALSVGFLITALVFGLNSREAITAGYKALPSLGLGSLYQLIAKQFGPSFPGFAIMVFPYIAVIVFLALSLTRQRIKFKKGKQVLVLAGGVCLILMTSFIPYINTAKGVNLGDITKYINYYEQPDYALLMQIAQGGRLIVSMNKGFLLEGDSPVTFAWCWGVETVNGPYNQGDPKFFQYTVHLEWEERWLGNPITRENLMQEGAAKYIFNRGTIPFFPNTENLYLASNNNYGRIWALNGNISYADSVTPILLDVKDQRAATEFFNILLPQGYRLVMVNIKDVPASSIQRFNYVMVDDAAKLSQYIGKTAWLLKNAGAPSVNENSGTVTLNLPYQTLTDRICYHGDIANGYMWLGWDAWPGSQITPDIQATLTTCSKILEPYISWLSYNPVNYQKDNNQIRVASSPEFTLIKESYFPYWKSGSGQILPTTQGFMVASADTANLTLTYQRPLYYRFASWCSLSAIIIIIAVWLFLILHKSTPRAGNNHDH